MEAGGAAAQGKGLNARLTDLCKLPALSPSTAALCSARGRALGGTAALPCLLSSHQLLSTSPPSCPFSDFGLLQGCRWPLLLGAIQRVWDSVPPGAGPGPSSMPVRPLPPSACLLWPPSSSCPVCPALCHCVLSELASLRGLWEEGLQRSTVPTLLLDPTIHSSLRPRHRGRSSPPRCDGRPQGPC